MPNDERLVKLILQGDVKNPEGRSGALYKLAARLGESGVSPESTRAILEFSDQTWGKFLNREDRDERLQGLLNKAESVRPSQNHYAGYRPLTLSQLRDSAPKVDWLIHDLLAEATYAVITGGTGVGKSQLGLQLGMSLAKGVKWDTFQIEKSRVLYGSHEMNANELVAFTEKLALGLSLDEEQDIFHLIPIGQPISLLTKEGRDFYLGFLDDYDVFFFDTASSSTHLSMLDEATGLGLVSFFEILKSEGKTVIVLGHDTKEAVRNRGANAEDAYGHRLLIDRSSMVCRVSKFDDEHVVLGYPKVRLAKPPQSVVYARQPNLWLERTNLQLEDFKREKGKNPIQVLLDSGVVEKPVEERDNNTPF